MSPTANHAQEGPAASWPLDTRDVLRTLEGHGYHVVDGPPATARPGRMAFLLATRTGTAVMAKVYPDGSGQKVFANMQRLWLSPFGQGRSSPGLLQPLDYVPAAGALITEYIPGKPLIELGRVTEPHLNESMRLLADLHSCGVLPEVRRGWRGILRSLDRKLQRMREVGPSWATHVEPVVQALHERRVKDTELICSHGDFSARNVLISPGRTALIDWDRLQQADPARDVTYFAVWPWREAIQRGRMPDRQSLKIVLQTYARFRPAGHLRRQVPFHAAAALVRMCCSLVELWPAQAYLVPGLARGAGVVVLDDPVLDERTV